MTFNSMSEARVARGDAGCFVDYEYVRAIALLFAELASKAACESSAFRGCYTGGYHSPSRHLPSGWELTEEDCCDGFGILEVDS
jgi:hypothetical protein